MRIAIVGTGIAGLTAAHLLSRDHDLTVFEAEDRLGGHTNTVDVPWGSRTYPVDTGFIVCNEATYPNFLRLMGRLGVSLRPTEMSFSVRREADGLEYRPSTLGTLFAQRRNLLRPHLYRILRDLPRFKRAARRLLDGSDTSTTLGAFVESEGLSADFRDLFLVPMGAAIWSADPDAFADIPAAFFARFFDNHGILRVTGQPRWLTLVGGSRTYLEPLAAPFRDRVRLSCPVESITREGEDVLVRPAGGAPERFDHVVVAAHSDQALGMLADPSGEERAILGAIPYQANETVLHTDTSVLPRRRKVWASWNYLVPKRPRGRVAVTYDMNILQGLEAPAEFLVTLNPPPTLDPSRILRRMVYHHPVFTAAGTLAQARRHEISGARRTWYCGAYWRNGFHEDGVVSALTVCEGLGAGL